MQQESRKGIWTLAVRGKMELKFICPECKHSQITSVERVWAEIPITAIRKDGDLDYGEPAFGNGQPEWFECANCHYVLKDENGENITDNSKVVEWVKKNCKGSK